MESVAQIVSMASQSDIVSSCTCTLFTHTHSCRWGRHYVLLSHWGSPWGTWRLQRLWTPWNSCRL